MWEVKQKWSCFSYQIVRSLWDGDDWFSFCSGSLEGQYLFQIPLFLDKLKVCFIFHIVPTIFTSFQVSTQFPIQIPLNFPPHSLKSFDSTLDASPSPSHLLSRASLNSFKSLSSSPAPVNALHIRSFLPIKFVD
jgi:hypothetical protein